MKPIVLLIHGLKTRSILTGHGEAHHNTDQPVAWEKGVACEFHDLPLWLTDDGCEVYFATFDNGYKRVPAVLDCVETIRKQILHLVQKNPKQKITIIAHSISGLIMRAYIDGSLYSDDKTKLGYDFIKNVIMIGTPNNGSPYSSFMQFFSDYKNNPNLAGLQNIYDHRFVEEFNQKFVHKNIEIPYYVVAGNHCSMFFGRPIQAYVALRWGNNDGACPIRSAFNLENVAGKAIVPYSHEGILGHCYYSSDHGKQNVLYAKYLRPLIIKNDPSSFCETPTDTAHFPAWVYVLMIVMFPLFATVAFIRYLQLRQSAVFASIF